MATERICDLYLNKKLSDVTIVVDNVELPAHIEVLAQRCPYFKAMFSSGMIESTSKRIEVRETSIDGFRLVLQWIYTGTVEFESVDSTFDALRLAQMYVLESEFESLACYFLRKICSVDNVCFILNNAVVLSIESLIDFAVDFVNKNPCKILKRESFKQLSLNALNKILIRVVIPASDHNIFYAVVGWMEANPLKAAGFSHILEKVSLDFLTDKDMAALPPNVQDAVAILIRQNKTCGLTYCLKDENVALPKYGVKAITDNKNGPVKTEAEVIQKPTSGSSEKHNLNDFQNPFSLSWFYLVNFIQMMVTCFEFIAQSILDLILPSVDALRYNTTWPCVYCNGSFSIKEDADVLKHSIGKSNNSILIDLGHRFLLNSFKMQLLDSGNSKTSYWIAVSKDNVKWTRVIDHSEDSCCRLQTHKFAPRSVRFIRICGTAPVNGIFKISNFEASYKLKPFIYY